MGASERERIVRAAAELFHVKGPQSTANDEIWQQAAVTPETYLAHFPEREQLIAEVAQYQMDRILEVLEPYLARVELHGDVDAWYTGITRLLDVAGTYACPVGVLALDATPQQAIRRALSRFVKRHVQALEACKASGHFAPEFDPLEASRFAGTMIQGSLLLSRAFQDNTFFHRSVGQLRSYIEGFRR